MAPVHGRSSTTEENPRSSSPDGRSGFGDVERVRLAGDEFARSEGVWDLPSQDRRLGGAVPVISCAMQARGDA